MNFEKIFKIRLNYFEQCSFSFPIYTKHNQDLNFKSYIKIFVSILLYQTYICSGKGFLSRGPENFLPPFNHPFLRHNVNGTYQKKRSLNAEEERSDWETISVEHRCDVPPIKERSLKTWSNQLPIIFHKHSCNFLYCKRVHKNIGNRFHFLPVGDA